jgi:hypothetical protein
MERYRYATLMGQFRLISLDLLGVHNFVGLNFNWFRVREKVILIARYTILMEELLRVGRGP